MGGDARVANRGRDRQARHDDVPAAGGAVRLKAVANFDHAGTWPGIDRPTCDRLAASASDSCVKFLKSRRPSRR